MESTFAQNCFTFLFSIARRSYQKQSLSKELEACLVERGSEERAIVFQICLLRNAQEVSWEQIVSWRAPKGAEKIRWTQDCPAEWSHTTYISVAVNLQLIWRSKKFNMGIKLKLGKSAGHLGLPYEMVTHNMSVAIRAGFETKFVCLFNKLCWKQDCSTEWSQTT